LADVLPADACGNILQGPAVTLDAKNCIVHSSERLTAVVDVEGLIVVSTADAVLVVPKDKAQKVRDLVTLIGSQGSLEATHHLRVDRPWGYYERLDCGERFQVKRIFVVPGGMLSLQSHTHRAEHWVVVRGCAEVVVGDCHRTLEENESMYIPMGSIHRLANKGQSALEIIEVQTGDYLGEDDIVRYDDIYNRNS
jgi:mannose-1-phosphate guanylyltransferase/mannose-6-phosphate isomerase